jgi:hypothetical protein
MSRRRVRTRWWPREWHWYSHYGIGIEPPLPWLLIAIYSAPVLAVLAVFVTIEVLT